MNPEPGNGQLVEGQVIDWLMRLQEAPDDEALRGRFERWLGQSESHKRAYATVEPLWRTSAGLPPLSAARREAARGPRPWRRLRKRAAVLAVTAMAACIAWLAVPMLQLRLAADHLTATAELRNLVLEDGSRVTLDAASAIAVDYTPTRRAVRLLSGQAFFEVTPSAQRPFVVMAGPVSVTVTGTAFDVGMSEAGVAVEVQSGTVTVARTGHGPPADLRGGQRLKIANSGQVVQGTVEPENVGAWRDHRVVVYGASVREVVEQIGRYMPGIIVFGDAAIADGPVSGIIDLSRPADALRALVDLQQGSITTITPYLTVITSR